MSTRCQIEFYDAERIYEGEKTQFIGEPIARIYHHSDGYPSYILPALKWLEKFLSKSLPMYGPRQTDTAWVATEFVVQHRLRSDQKRPKNCTSRFAGGYRSHGCVYIDNQIHEDIEYLYRVICAERWTIKVYRPTRDSKWNITGFAEITPDELSAMPK